MVCDKGVCERWCVTPGPAQCHKCHACHAKTKVDVTKCHTCHTKRRWMSPSATLATQSAAASPATKTGPSAPPEPAQCHKRHACHAKTKVDVTAPRNEGGCHQVPPATQSAAGSPRLKQTGPSAPPEPAQCHNCHACHAKRRWM